MTVAQTPESPRSRAGATRSDPTVLAGVAALTVIGLLLRLSLCSQPMRFDESTSYVQLASRSLHTCLTVYLHANNHPLCTVLVHLSAELFGNHPWAVRLPALVAGVLLVPATFRTFERVFDATSALLASALVAASAPLVEYATNARGYSLQALFVVLLFGAAARILDDPAPRRWGPFVAWTALGFYSVPTMVFYFLAVLVFMAGSASPDRRRRLVVHLGAASAAAGVVVVLLYVPFTLRSGLGALTSNGFVGNVSWGDLGKGLGETLVACVRDGHRGLPLPVEAVMLTGFGVSVAAQPRMSRFRVSPAVATIGACLAVMLAQRALAPERVFVPCVPLYLASSAAGLRWMAGRISVLSQRRSGRRRLAGRPLVLATVALAVLVSATASASVLGSGAAYQTHDDQVLFSDAEGMTVALAELGRDGDTVYVQAAASMILRYYFELHHVPTDRIHAYGSPAREGGRSFVIDASADEPEFTVQEALGHGGPAHPERDRLVPILALPRSTLYGLVDEGG